MAYQELELSLPDLHKSLRQLKRRSRIELGESASPRLRFVDGPDTYRMLLQESNLGFNVSGTLNGAIAYQLNTTIFSKSAKVGDVVLRIASAPTGVTVEEFFT